MVRCRPPGSDNKDAHTIATHDEQQTRDQQPSSENKNKACK